MKTILFLLVISSSLSCNRKETVTSELAEQTDTLTARNINSEPANTHEDSIKTIDIGYGDQYDKLPTLSFQIITEKEFLSVKPKEYIQTFKARDEDEYYFQILTVTNNHSFSKYMDYGREEGWSGYEFAGYYPATKLFALTEKTTSEGLGFGELFLLDSLTDYRYNIVSFGDASVELPIPSPNDNYLVYYYNSAYEHKNCDIGVLKINDKSVPKSYLSTYASYKSTDFAIENIVWKSDSIFYVKGYQEYYEDEKWVKEYSYYKTELK